MKKLVTMCLLVGFTAAVVGCAEPQGDVVGGADQSAIEAYQAAQAADLAAMETDMKDAGSIKKKK